jgi:hypothetical protein
MPSACWLCISSFQYKCVSAKVCGHQYSNCNATSYCYRTGYFNRDHGDHIYANSTSWHLGESSEF